VLLRQAPLKGNKEARMEKAFEFVDAWMTSQKEFMENWVKSQRDFMEKWIEATRQLQETFLTIGGPQEGLMKESFNQFRTWSATMEQSSKAFVDETGKIHELWKNAADKQMDMSRQMIKNYMELFKAASPKK
jgi:hypothetical protein